MSLSSTLGAEIERNDAAGGDLPRAAGDPQRVVFHSPYYPTTISTPGLEAKSDDADADLGDRLVLLFGGGIVGFLIGVSTAVALTTSTGTQLVCVAVVFGSGFILPFLVRWILCRGGAGAS